MATNFFSRWSQRKLDESNDEPLEVEQTLEATELTSSDSSSEVSSEMEAAAPQSLESDALETNEEVHASDVQDPAPEATEDLSVAQLLVSEASESVKKAALRKLFLSEEFNVRDGLDDYDDDYSNLKSLSEGVAETLRDWVKDKTEEETTPEEEQVIDNKTEGEVLEHSESDLEVSDNEFETSESAEITEQEKQLYKNTVSDNNATMSDEADLKEMGQNIPHKE
ncbi:DUF3306 domain-containing protein [Vibrio splendidus]|uniref:DUF3306 domain-containing protein n=1 Tax=Vibrio splendidus TaxID=29497 RepID=UPI0024682531|nr:DUF3306 domain-containing protein [Vibrio splendidus]MDH5911675.1 DUF3306 domain-containing protein [Vibrio splendidus]MDH5941893.1 DUF3306 domain-containing protein [Vibrio splendidus]MDH5985913.1 DUF3306 domain-containing protein [Vibrio splendidus]MDH5993857.1 DUF3306 domain-containing protein [Vibrio splendidus]MDH6004617.1 DUF3306 domain-containing protein [Vibrio splendidus]